MSSNIPYIVVKGPVSSDSGCVYNIGIRDYSKEEMYEIINKSKSLNQVEVVKHFCSNKIKALLNNFSKSNIQNINKSYIQKNIKLYQNIINLIKKKYPRFVGPVGSRIQIIRRSPTVSRQLSPEFGTPSPTVSRQLFPESNTPSASHGPRFGLSSGSGGFTNYSKSHLIKRIESKLKRMKKDKISKILKSIQR